MIHQLVFIFSFLFSLFLLPSCTMFFTSDDPLEEAGYEEEGGYATGDPISDDIGSGSSSDEVMDDTQESETEEDGEEDML